MSGMKAGDFTKCRLCGKGVAHTNVPLFYRVKIERMGFLTGKPSRGCIIF